ncbi:hypothetical protein Pan44_07010 [Caulifigura coniformis]|uniref:Uncharacterized protein n=1 Tax=Caulifigura coniformis TaxID=2527983 RepID=A0A517S993_9PLAN|nr:hypothetical protein Pan44_07010 [Caulifigura coniformis]
MTSGFPAASMERNTALVVGLSVPGRGTTALSPAAHLEASTNRILNLPGQPAASKEEVSAQSLACLRGPDDRHARHETPAGIDLNSLRLLRRFARELRNRLVAACSRHS